MLNASDRARRGFHVGLRAAPDLFDALERLTEKASAFLAAQEQELRYTRRCELENETYRAVRLLKRLTENERE